ncbi:MAG: hypothetical protein IJV55_08170 [Paludibacteraceae bacterium]|nr:hypothetical protein [Paludibacteraceae bacterium]
MKPPLVRSLHLMLLGRKAVLAVAALLLVSVLPAQAAVRTTASEQQQSWWPDWQAPVGFTYTAGFNVVSNYLWRGFCVGGLSFQPNFNVGYGGFYAGAWWNVGATDNLFRGFFPEVDVYIGFSRCGFTLELTHMHYFDGTPFFRFSQRDLYGGGNANNTELHFQWRVSDRLPLSLDWYTHIGSEDGYVVDADGNYVGLFPPEGVPADGMTVRRAFSSYLQLGYDFALPYDITIPVRVGMTPWKSRYTRYEGGATVNCISVSLEKVFRLGFGRINIFGRAMLNPDRISKNNVFVPLDGRDWHINDKNPHLVGTIGLGMWF